MRDHGNKWGKLKRHESIQGLQFSEPQWNPMVVLWLCYLLDYEQIAKR